MSFGREIGSPDVTCIRALAWSNRYEVHKAGTHGVGDGCVKYPSAGRRVMMIFLKEKMMIFLLFVLRLQGD